MNTTLRNLTLSAAALAALTVIAPRAAADDHGRGRHGSPRQEYRVHGRHANFRHAPRHVVRYGFAAPYRHDRGFRFYSACPGPGYAYVAGYGWALPPFFGAVWVPAHYDFRGFWVEGHWR